MPIVKINNLVKRYPVPENPHTTFYAVDHISLDILDGEIFGILGPNGAGKTTTLEMIEGLTDIDEGEVTIANINVKTSPFEIKEIIGVQLQASEYFDKLSLRELLDLFCKLYQSPRQSETLLAKVNLSDKSNATPEQLSGGQKQRFSIACALVNDPKVLFLDEPTTGLDPQAKRNLWNLVKKLNASGMTIVITTHNMEEAEFLCQRIAIMDQGKIIALNSPSNLILKYAPEPPETALHGNLEDVFLHLTGNALRD